MTALPPTSAILVVDDDQAQRSLLDTFLRSQGMPTLTAASGQEALDQLSRQSVSMIISDVRMPGLSGLQLLRKVRDHYPRLPFLLVTAYANLRDAIGATRDGALNYLSKPIDLDELLSLVQQATGPHPTASAHPEPPLNLPDGIIAEGPLMRSVFRDAALVAPSDSRILITGESGVGKEVLADVIHSWSSRASGPLVKINCAAIPENLLESELFGHEKGAFTDAHQRHIGCFEEANHGTILLDEIGEMSPKLQAKLLRITQDGSFRRLGSTSDLVTHARILAATNIDLDRQLAEGRFREDLFYRLNVLELNIPPLRERPEDILPMATHFFSVFTRLKPRFSASVVECLMKHRWPGNVRELRNAMERAALLSRGEVILLEHLPQRVQAAATATPPPLLRTDQRLEELERDAILGTLRKNHFNRTATAKALGISRRALVYKLRDLRQLGFPVDPEPS